MADTNLSRLDQGYHRLQAYPQRDTSLDSRFRELIQGGDDSALSHINAYHLAAAWNVESQPVLVWLLYSSQAGLFDLNWVTRCPDCTGVSNVSGRLGLLGHESSCMSCQATFGVHSDQTVEVTFTVSRSIRATQTPIRALVPDYVEILGECDATQPIVLDMQKPGRYVLANVVGEMPDSMARIDVEPGKPTLSEIDLTYYPKAVSPQLTVLGPGTMTLHVKGASKIAIFFGGADTPRAPRQAVSGLDVMLTPDFKSVFAHDTLSQRESLSVKNLTILFTDITGSTALYGRLGDVRAYNLVRDHFDVLFAEIEKHRGMVVKTIGDSVMAAFSSPDEALKAALAVQKSIRHFNEDRSPDQGAILVKVGLHEGSAIAVNLNNTLDYFGNMVNLAARIQSKSRSEEVLISEQVHQDSEVQQILTSDPQLMVTDSIFELHGIGEQRLYSVMTH